jgi:hypothetical protein
VESLKLYDIYLVPHTCMYFVLIRTEMLPRTQMFLNCFIDIINRLYTLLSSLYCIHSCPTITTI